MTIAERIAAAQQQRILAVLLDHVAKFAEVVDQQPEASLVFIGRLHGFQQIGDEILEFGFLDFESHLQRALDRKSWYGFALISPEQVAQPQDNRIFEIGQCASSLPSRSSTVHTGRSADVRASRAMPNQKSRIVGSSV